MFLFLQFLLSATGTFLGGRIFVGDVSYAGGPDGMFPATELAGALKKLGIDGAIAGKAVYTGTLDLAKAIKEAE